MTYNIEQFSLLPLFSMPIGVATVKEDTSNLEKLKKYDYKHLFNQSAYGLTTNSLHVLNDFEKEKEILWKYVEDYLYKVLMINPEVKFKMTTSWGTLTRKESTVQSHNHRNSLYSGVYYYSAMHPGDMLMFQSPGNQGEQIYLTPPKEFTIFNSLTWRIEAKYKTLILFPSITPHMILIGDHVYDRYSIAFNLFPTGKFGDEDSSIELELK